MLQAGIKECRAKVDQIKAARQDRMPSNRKKGGDSTSYRLEVLERLEAELEARQGKVEQGRIEIDAFIATLDQPDRNIMMLWYCTPSRPTWEQIGAKVFLSADRCRHRLAELLDKLPEE